MKDNDRLSFLPDGFESRSSRRRVGGVAIAGLVFAAITSGVGVQRSRLSLHAAESRYADVSAELDVATSEMMRARELAEQHRRLLHQTLETSASLSQVLPSKLLAETANALPNGVTLLEFSLDTHRRAETPVAFTSAFEMKRNALETRRLVETSSEPIYPSNEQALHLACAADSEALAASCRERLIGLKIFTDVKMTVDQISSSDNSVERSQRQFELVLRVKQ